MAVDLTVRGARASLWYLHVLVYGLSQGGRLDKDERARTTSLSTAAPPAAGLQARFGKLYIQDYTQVYKQV